MFGGNTGVTYEDVQRKRKLAEALLRGGAAPRNVGEGLHAIGSAIAGRMLDRKADKMSAQLPIEGQQPAAVPRMASKAIASALMGGGGVSQLAGGGGQDRLDYSAQTPLAPVLAPGEMQADRYFQGPDMEFFQSLPPDAQEWAMEGAMDGVSPAELRDLYESGVYQPVDVNQYDPASRERLRANPSDMAPAPVDPRELIGGAGAGELGGGSGTDYLSGDDINAVEKRAANDGEALKIKHALMSLFESLDDYESIYKGGGATIKPGVQRDKLTTQRRAIQMQMKDLYNLGALQGPDLALLESLMVDPTSVSGNILNFLGIADMDQRFGENADQIREIMLDLAAPRLREYGISVDQIKDLRREGNAPQSPSELSDDELLKMLTGG